MGLINSRFCIPENGDGTDAQKKEDSGRATGKQWPGLDAALSSQEVPPHPELGIGGECPKSDQKDLKGRMGTLWVAFTGALRKTYSGYTHPGLFTLSSGIPTRPLWSSDSRSFATIPHMNLPQKTPVQVHRYESKLNSKDQMKNRVLGNHFQDD